MPLHYFLLRGVGLAITIISLYFFCLVFPYFLLKIFPDSLLLGLLWLFFWLLPLPCLFFSDRIDNRIDKYAESLELSFLSKNSFESLAERLKKEIFNKYKWVNFNEDINTFTDIARHLVNQQKFTKIDNVFAAHDFVPISKSYFWDKVWHMNWILGFLGFGNFIEIQLVTKPNNNEKHKLVDSSSLAYLNILITFRGLHTFPGECFNFSYPLVDEEFVFQDFKKIKRLHEERMSPRDKVKLVLFINKFIKKTRRLVR